MKITLTELKEIIKEEILAEKIRRRKRRRRERHEKLSKGFYPAHPYPYNLSPEELLQRYETTEEEDSSYYGQVGDQGIEIA
jgi:hypothetical protein